MSDNKLKLVSVTISNVLGVSELQINPTSNIIEVSGRNGEGKTSVIESIKSAVGVSDYSTLLRNGEKKGKVVLELDNMNIQKSFNEKGDTLKIEGKVAGTDMMSNISRPASVLKGLINPDSVDPVRLLTCKPKELLNAVLGAIPLSVEADKMFEIFGNQVQYDLGEHALVVLGKQTARVMEERKLVNRDAKQFKISGDQLASTLPENIPLTEELQTEINENLEKIEGIRTAARRAARDSRTPFTKKLAEKETEIALVDADIERLQDELMNAKGRKYQLTSDKLNIETERDEASAKASNDALDKGDEYQARNVELAEEISNLKVLESTQKMVKDWQDKEAVANKTSDTFTEQLSAINEYKSKLCDNLPIDGLTIEDGLLHMNDIPFQTLNTAARIELVLELAKLSSGTLGLVVLDNSENMDSNTYKLFLEKAAETDLTFVVGRVTDSELTIK